ncbi:MAG: serine/threonine-protein kinase, partial [Planctomycetota bacterium]
MTDELSIRHQIDLICDRFEQALKDGGPVDIEDFLDDVATEHQELLRDHLQQLLSDYRARESKSGFEPTIAPDSVTAPDLPPSASDDVTLDSQTVPNEHQPLATDPTATDTVTYFGDYELLGEIARGGMGVVYRARQTSLGRVVALKMILSGQLAGSREIARFQSEAEAAATLDHPGIVPIYEVGRHKDCHYFSMGFVDGPSLSETLREGPLEPRIAAAKLSQIADAVDYAHARGVIHRDLKPGNVLLDTRGEPHITDFGLAKRMQADTELTTSGEVLGTPAYMPPEQARGDLEAIGPTSDVYSLGAILYAMLSGRPPHSAPSMAETLRQVIETEALSVRSLSPSTPKDLETICATCLAKEPAKRYASAGALRDELDRFLEGKPIQARPVTPVERLWRWAKRHPVPAVLSAALVLLLATLAIGGPLTAINQNRLKQAAQRNEARANQLAASERDARDRSNRSLYARTISLAFQELQTGNLFGAEDLLGSLPSSQRGFEWRYVQSLCHQELESFFGLNALAYSVEVAPDGVHVMAMARGNQPRVCSWQSGDDLPRQTRNVYGIAISTDGSKMAIADASDNNGFQIVDSVTGEVQQTFAGHERGVGFADFGGPDDSMIATVGRDKTVRIWDVASGKQLLVIRVPYRQRLHPVALSPDGSLVAWSRGDDGGIEIRKTSNGNIIFESLSRNTFKGNDTPVEFSPDGSLLAVGGFGEVLLLDPQTGDDLGSLHGTRAKSYGFDFSPDGKRLVVGSEDGMVRVFDVDRRRLLTTMTGHKVGASYGVIAVAFDGSGDRIVSSGFNGVVKVWDAWNGDRREAIDDARSDAEGPRPSQSVDFVATMPEATQRLRFADDGSVLLAAGSGDTAAMIDPNNGDVIRKWKDLPGNQGAIDYHASSHRMVVGGGSILDRWPGEVRLLDAISGDLVWKFDDTRGPISGLRFFDDGKRIAVGVGSQNANTGGVLVLETQSGELQWRNPSSMLPVRDLDVSPDGATIATVGHDDGVTLWNATTGEKEKTLGDRVFYSVAFASDGQKIAVGSVDWSVRLFEINSSDLIWTSRRHTGAVMQLAFTENDTRLVSTALDGHTRIWDTRYGDSVLAMRDSDLANLSLAVAPDASAIAVSGFNPTIALRRIPKNIATQSEVVDANAPASDEWVTLVEDDFERDQLGDGWKPSGSWEIVDGVACGTLAPTPYGPGLNAANLASTTMVSSDFEVSFDAWIDQPMIAEAKVSDIAVQHAISSLFVGVVKSPINRSEKGVAVSHLIHRSFREVGSRRDGPFQFEVDRKYRFRTRRDGDRIELWIDNESYRTVQLSDQTPMPMMSIQGIFGPVGSKIYVDNVLIKVPRDGLAESVAADLVVKAFESAKIKPLVINAIRNADVSEFGDDPMATRTAALKLASRWPQENDEILAKIETLARKDEVPADDYQAMLDWVQGSIPSQNDRGNRVASMCAFRLNDRTIAWEMTKQANQKHVREHGYRHPIDLAIPGMMLNQNNAEIAVANLRQLREIMRSDHWRKNQQATAWAKEAEQRI